MQFRSTSSVALKRPFGEEEVLGGRKKCYNIGRAWDSGQGWAWVKLATLQAAMFKKEEIQGELWFLGGQVAWDSLDWAGLKDLSCGRMGVEWAEVVQGYTQRGTQDQGFRGPTAKGEAKVQGCVMN